MAEDLDCVVKVLYDYTYKDDTGEDIKIRAGEIYRLVEKTNEEWWQVYDPSDMDGESFFVPAKYVEIVEEESTLKALSDLDKLLSFGDNPHQEDPYSTTEALTGFRAPVVVDEHSTYINVNSSHKDNADHEANSHISYINVRNTGSNEVDDPGGGNDEYMNLGLYRSQAGIQHPVPAERNPQETNKELIQGTVPPPRPEEGTYVKVLHEGLPWDIYQEPTLGRHFFVNRITGERMWKPPRRPGPSQLTPTTPEEQVPGPSSGSPSFAVREEGLVRLPAGYEQVTDNGNVYFIHRGTQEKWKRLVDQVGRQYFHKVGSSDQQWKSPSSSWLRSHNTSAEAPQRSVSVAVKMEAGRGQPQDVNWEAPNPRMSTFGGVSAGGPPQLCRTSKASSTYRPEASAASKPDNRSSTLPANFTVARPAPVAADRGLNISTLPAQPGLSLPSPPSNASRPLAPAQEEVYEGYINKAKILDTNKKKCKKSWSPTYLVLRGSNLIFYKDQKSAANDKQNEGVVSLQGAHVNFNPSKEITSRKNSVLLQVSSGNMFLFQSDNEKTIHEWFFRMKLVANDVTPVRDPSPANLDVKEDKKEKGMSRSISSDDTISVHSVDKNKNMVGIRAKLLSLISRRPTKDELEKKGIIKDAVFGSRLHELCDREKQPVPYFVHQCIAAVESRGLLHDGLYRVSGNMAEIQRLRCAVDKDENYNLYDAQWDVHVLTGSLKLFFRELKEPLYPFNMYNAFSEAIRKENTKERLSAFKKVVSDLPRCNYFTLRDLFHHLCKVIQMSHENRMQIQNVAIVFGPTLMWQQVEAGGGSLAVSTMHQSRIVEYMLQEFSNLFKQ